MALHSRFALSATDSKEITSQTLESDFQLKLLMQERRFATGCERTCAQQGQNIKGFNSKRPILSRLWNSRANLHALRLRPAGHFRRGGLFTSKHQVQI